MTLSFLHYPRFYFYHLLVTGPLLFSSCTHDEGLSFPVAKSFTDPNEKVITCKRVITASGDGWNAELENSNGKIFKLFLSFGVNGESILYTDHDSISASVVKTSRYHVEVSQNENATLTFEKGSNLDLMGESTDKEFVILRATNDTISLSGTNFSNSLTLTKALPAEGKKFESGDISKNIAAIGAYMETAKYLNAEILSGKVTQIVMSTSSRGILFTYVENEVIKYAGSNFYYTDKGIYLKKNFTIYGRVIQEIFWDAEMKGMFILIDGSRVDIVGTSLPVIPLHYMIGKDYPSIMEFPPNLDGDQQPGWSDQFLYVWDYDKTNLYNKKFWILLGLQFSIDVTAKTMNLDFYYVGDNSKNVSKARFPYAFTMTADGIYKFTPLPPGNDADGNNALAIQVNLTKTLSTFNNNSFRIELFDAMAELNSLLPQFKSVEDTDIYFTGRFLR